MSGPKKSKAQLRREEQERIRKERERQLALKKKMQEERLRKELEEKIRKERITKCRNILNNYVFKIETLQKNLNNELRNYSIVNQVQSDNASNTTYNKALTIKVKTEKFSASVKHISDDEAVLEKNISDEDFLKEAIEVKKMCRKHNVPLIINDNVKIALECGLAGNAAWRLDLPCKQG